MMKFIKFILIIIIFSNTAFAENIIINSERLTLKEAIEIMLSSNPSIRIYKKNAEIIKAGHQQARGDFDFVLSTFITEERDWPDKNRSQLTYNQITSGIQISKKTRFGIELNGGVKATHIEQNAGKTDNPNAYFNLSAPLIRSWKKTINAADEISSEIEYQAAKLDMQDAVSLDIMTLAIAYWHHVAAYERLQIAAQTEKRAETLVNEIKVLIKNGERPASDINLSLANLAKSSALRVSEEQNFLEKMHTLLELMGYTDEEFEKSYCAPGNNLPDVADNKWNNDAIYKRLVKKAIESRKIYQAYKKKQNSAETQMLAARNKKKPNLNLNLGLNVSKYQEGFELTEKYGPFYSGSISLSYAWPIGNNEAIGNYSRNLANYQKILLEITLLEKKIKSNIATKLSNIVKIVERYKEREKSVKFYNKTLENEKKKFKLGMSTTIDVISTEQSYLYALLDRLDDRLEYASALSELAYETGNIDIVMNGDSKIDFNIFFNLTS